MLPWHHFLKITLTFILDSRVTHAGLLLGILCDAELWGRADPLTR